MMMGHIAQDITAIHARARPIAALLGTIMRHAVKRAEADGLERRGEAGVPAISGEGRAIGHSGAVGANRPEAAGRSAPACATRQKRNARLPQHLDYKHATSPGRDLLRRAISADADIGQRL
jgi:hypothetical protein